MLAPGRTPAPGRGESGMSAQDRDETSTDRVRRYLLAGAMVLCPVLLLTGTALEVDTGDSGLEEVTLVAAERGQFYASTLLLALGLVLLTPTALGLMQLARRRGGALATIGGGLLFVAGSAAAAGIFMYGAVLAVASDAGLPREEMGQFARVASESGYTAPPFFLGFFGISIGLVLLGIALLRARTVPRWMPALLVVGAFTTFFGQGGTAVTLLTTSPLLVLVGFAAALVRPHGEIVLPDVPGQRPATEPASTPADAGV